MQAPDGMATIIKSGRGLRQWTQHSTPAAAGRKSSALHRHSRHAKVAPERHHAWRRSMRSRKTPSLLSALRQRAVNWPLPDAAFAHPGMPTQSAFVAALLQSLKSQTASTKSRATRASTSTVSVRTRRPCRSTDSANMRSATSSFAPCAARSSTRVTRRGHWGSIFAKCGASRLALARNPSQPICLNIHFSR